MKATEGKKVKANEGDFERLRCRFYEARYPVADEVVMVNVVDIGEMGATLTLLEYDNIEVIWFANIDMAIVVIMFLGNGFAVGALKKENQVY
jgi:hypothetical protein